jgi:hypothetical protein
VVPVLWAIVGTSAAFTLGIRADLALAVAAAVLVLDSLVPTVLGPGPQRNPPLQPTSGQGRPD